MMLMVVSVKTFKVNSYGLLLVTLNPTPSLHTVTDLSFCILTNAAFHNH